VLASKSDRPSGHGFDPTRHQYFEIVSTTHADFAERVEAGEETAMTKRCAPVAKRVPVKKEASLEERAAAIKRIQTLAKGLSLGRLKIKDLISEGRR
jgi:antitoxin (DNA-binding transcriptional repressor) of toxin-antitoxin stability system